MFDRVFVVPVLLALAAPVAAQDFKVIAHPGQGAGGLTTVMVSRLFLKKETRWPDGRLAKPVVLADERVRPAFYRRVLRKTPGAVYAYWNQMIFSGQDVPPPEKRTASEIVEYVRSTPGAIGFVPAGTEVSDVRVVVLKD
jgi:hypothetical protein